jgi:hypothetical protein
MPSACAPTSFRACSLTTSKLTEDGLPVHSFRTLLDDLATLAYNVCHTPLNPDAKLVIERLRRTQYEARLIAEVAKSRHDMLLRAEKRRVRAEKSILISNRLLRNLTEDHANVLYIGRVGSRYEPGAWNDR